MKDDLKILELIKNSEKGDIDLPTKMYVYLPEKAFTKDERGNLVKANYMCSEIISIVKYSESKINVSYVDLPPSYKGKKINFIDDDEYNWHYATMNPIKLARYKGSTDWKEFKK